MEMQMETETETEIEMEMDPETDTETEMEMEMEMDPETETEMMMETETEKQMMESYIDMMAKIAQLLDEEYEMERQLEDSQEEQKERENNGKGGGESTSTPSNSDSAQGAGAGKVEETLISSVIQKLHIQHVELCKSVYKVKIIKMLINELSMTMNSLRGRGMTVREFNSSIFKVIEMTRYLDDIIRVGKAKPVVRRLREIKMRIMKSGADARKKKALILSVIQMYGRGDVSIGLVYELRMILDFLRDETPAPAEVRTIEFLIRNAIDIAKSVKSRLRGVKLGMLESAGNGEEDPDAVILHLMQCLQSESIEIYKHVGEVEDIKGVMNELRMVLDFLREERTVVEEEDTRHKYLICDLIEMAMYLDEIDDPSGKDLCTEAKSVQSWLREIRLRLRMLQSETRSKDVGEEKGEEVDDHVVVGLDKQVETLLRRGIFNEREGLQTSAITGIVGIGKTSLARQVYNHASVVDRFKRRAWVCVSGDITHKEILMKLVQQVVLDSDSSLILLEEMDNRSLQHILHQHLQGMPYLIVLDGLPKQMHLKSLLKNALPHDDDKARLLVTSSTRNIPTTMSYIHALKPLDSDNSWKLFLNTLFHGNKFTSEHKFPKYLQEKAREMLRKCGGLPLAIKEVALQLAEQRRRGREWEKLLDLIDWDSILALLENFYQQLDEQQKSCFLHLALFKENTTMRAEKLGNVLVAGGVASESDVVTYLKKLNTDSIVEFKHVSVGTRLKSCDINVLLHRLSMKKAEEEIGLEILSNNNPPSQSIPRHRIINCSREKFDHSTNQDEYLVSLFFRGGGRYLDATPSYWKSFELKLKILDLEDFGLKILPESIGTLIELRYLGLRNNYLKKLPHSLVCLKKLEVLDVAHNFMAEVPDIIWDMSSLRRVFMSGAIFQKPLKIDALRKLVTVIYISIDDLICELSSLQTTTSLEEVGTDEEDDLQTTTSLEEVGTDEEDDLQTTTSLEELSIEEEDSLQTITSLEELAIEKEDRSQMITGLYRLSIEDLDANSDVRKLFESLVEWDAIEHLVLRGFRFRSMPCLDELHNLHSLTTLRLEGLLAKLPSAKNFPPCISYLRLVNTCLDEDPMPVLEQLPYLKQLKLRNAYTGRQMVISDNWLTRIDALCIEELWNLRNVYVEKGSLKWLKKLEIKNCPLLETLPEEIGSMAQLQEFNMTTTRNIATKIRKSGFISKIRFLNIDPS